MPARNELEVIGDGQLERASGYTYSHDDSSLATSLTVTLVRDMSRDFHEYDQDEEVNVRILGQRETYKVTDTEIQDFTQTVFMLSKDIDTAYKVATKELRFLSLNANETSDFRNYLNQEGSDAQNLDYTPYIKEFEYLFYPDRPAQIEGGWWAYGGAGDSIMDILGEMLDLTVVCALPPFRVRQFSVPPRSSIYFAMMELVAEFRPTVFIRNRTLYILEPNSSEQAVVLNITKAVSASERKLYKELSLPEDIVFDGGYCLFDPGLYCGPIFPERIVQNIPVYADNAGTIYDLGSLDIVSFGSIPDPETTITNLESPGYGVTQASSTIHHSVWDIFHSRQIRYHTLSSNYSFNLMTGVLEKTSDRDEFTRYQYLDPCFDTPRVDSGYVLDVENIMKTYGGIPDEIRTLQNWSRLTRNGAMQWAFSGAKQDYEYVLSSFSEFEFEWLFYDRYGRVAVRAKRVYADVHTPHFVPMTYEAYALKDHRSIQWKKAADIGYDGQLSGTLIKVIPGNPEYPAFDPRTIVLDIVETFIPTGKGMYRVERKRYYLDTTIDRHKKEVSSENVPKESLEKIPVLPKEMPLVLDPKARQEVEVLNRPTQRLTNQNVWVREETLEIFEYMKKHIAPVEVERTLTLPFSFYVPKDAVVRMREISDYRERTILPDRNITGRVSSYQCSKSSGGSSTTITIKGNLSAS